MQVTLKVFRTVFILIICAVSSCNNFSDKDSIICEDTAMDKVQEPLIYLKIIISLSPNLLDRSPEKVTFTGNIGKIFCDGNGGDNHDFNSYFLISNESFEENSATFILPESYQFTFENTRDKLLLEFLVTLHLEDGSVYESSEISGYYFYEDLLYSEDDQHYYLEINPGSLRWFEKIP